MSAKGEAAKKAKGKAADKGKNKKNAKETPEAGGEGAVLSVASHPRAKASVRMAKGWGGLLAFAITAYISLSHGVSADMAGLRALIAGAVGYVLAWGCAVMIWRQLMVAELRARVERARARAEPQRPAPAPAPAAEGAER